MNDREPRRPLRERVRPGEVLGLAGVLALFTGGGVAIATRNWLLAVEFAGAAFIAAILVCATLLLAITRPDPPDDDGPAHH